MVSGARHVHGAGGPIERVRYDARVRRITVRRFEQATAVLLRSGFGGDDLVDFDSQSFDDRFKLLLPQVGGQVERRDYTPRLSYWMEPSPPATIDKTAAAYIEGKAVTDGSKPLWSWPKMLILLLVQLWGAHALVFFTHEYAHSFTAWFLGWKSNPLDLHCPPLSPIIVFLQFGINQNVNEVPIFASGHGFDAALIAAAGAVLGNGLIALPLSRLAYRVAIARHQLGWALFSYWCTVASIGNFFDYVPIRTFTLEGDMGSVQRGFGWSPWLLLVIFGLPTLAAMIWLFLRIVPNTLRQLFPSSTSRQALISVVTVGVMFGFFGAVGLLEGGPVSHRLSMLSVSIVLPLMIVAALVGVRQLKASPLVARG